MFDLIFYLAIAAACAPLTIRLQRLTHADRRREEVESGWTMVRDRA